ncbi:DNA-binding protein [Cyanobium sp. Morenito 9A2]|uniref:helix-turn-helix domain-containing transcriptional regulator n=1 Tax=Cyanobium sp. Morenito 9A2 TaxID=2823718 RepID=UPI0020CFD59C|nr:hypothetical protein [Cyanobium sp. Morenito 9A2]
MTQIAREVVLGRETPYEALSPRGNLEVGTVLTVIAALGLQRHTTSRADSQA